MRKEYDSLAHLKDDATGKYDMRDPRVVAKGHVNKSINRHAKSNSKALQSKKSSITYSKGYLDKHPNADRPSKESEARFHGLRD
jgi:hypothetical protein